MIEEGELIPTPDPLQPPAEGNRQTGLPALRVPRLTSTSSRPAEDLSEAGPKYDLADHLDILGSRPSAQPEEASLGLTPVSYEQTSETSDSTIVTFAAPKLSSPSPVTRATSETAKSPAPTAEETPVLGWKKKER